MSNDVDNHVLFLPLCLPCHSLNPMCMSFLPQTSCLWQAGDFMFRQMMDLTLREDKDIIENIYPEYQRGFMNARYDRQVRRGDFRRLW